VTLNTKIWGFKGFFGDFGLRHTLQERTVPKSLEIDRDSLRMKLSALNVVFTSLNFAPCVQEILRTGASNLGTPSKYSHSASQTAAATPDGSAIWRM